MISFPLTEAAVLVALTVTEAVIMTVMTLLFDLLEKTEALVVGTIKATLNITTMKNYGMTFLMNLYLR